MRALPGDSAFLLDDGTHALLCDVGFGFTGAQVAQNVANHLRGRPLDAVLLTHSHYDHVLGLPHILQRYPQARVVAGSYAAGVFARPGARATMRALDEKHAARCGVQPYPPPVGDLRVDVAVNDGDTVTVGPHCLQAIALPGHTRCSVGYWCRAQGLLLGSETVGAADGLGQVLPSYLVGYRMTLDSIARVQALQPRRILVPHCGVLQGAACGQYLARAAQSARETAAHIVQMLREGQSKEAIVAWFKGQFYHGHIREMYPIDAMELNTGITVDLLARELLSQTE